MRYFPPSVTTRRGDGFTLIELLVVIAVIAILVVLPFSALAAAKAKGQGTACLNNRRCLMLALKMHPDDNDGRLGGVGAGLATFVTQP